MDTPDTGIPKANRYPVIYNHDLDKLNNFASGSEEQNRFRQQEVEGLAQQLHALASDSFAEMRDQEMERLSSYFDSFADIYGFDLRAAARTRMHSSQTVMNSSVLLLQRMFDDNAKSEQTGLTFFNGRMKAGNFDFNANGNTVIDGYTMTFSVLKRTTEDTDGKFEVDYPAYSLPREVISKLNQWNCKTNPDQPLAENSLITAGQEIMSRRVHDWIHASFLYDTQAANKTFLQWSKDSFFVPHFLSDPGMINYELMSNHMHFRVWQNIFAQNPQAKKQIIAEAKNYLKQVEDFTNWSKDDAMGNFLGYIGMRGVFDIIRYDDPDLNQAFVGMDRFNIIKNKIPDSSREFLDRIYLEDEQYYFREGTDEKVELKEILREYVQSLTSEAQANRLISENIALKTEVDFKKEFSFLPESIKTQIVNLNLAYEYDPRLFRQLNKNFEQLTVNFSPEMAHFLADKIEVDEQGMFYFRVNRDEVDLDNAATVQQKKMAILVQIPYTDTTQRTLTIQTANNLLQSHKRAQTQVAAGQLITINTQNMAIANRLVEQSTDEQGNFNIKKFFNDLDKASKSGLVELTDAYPYDIDKALKVYDVDGSNIMTDSEGHKIIRAGYYSTYHNPRPAVGAVGPISKDATQNPNTRRRILKGAIVKNHVQSEGELDIFPVHYESFDTFYASTSRHDLPALKVNSNFSGDLDNEKVNEALLATLPILESVNDKKLNGFRGKPQIPTFESIM